MNTISGKQQQNKKVSTKFTVVELIVFDALFKVSEDSECYQYVAIFITLFVDNGKLTAQSVKRLM